MTKISLIILQINMTKSYCANLTRVVVFIRLVRLVQTQLFSLALWLLTYDYKLAIEETQDKNRSVRQQHNKLLVVKGIYSHKYSQHGECLVGFFLLRSCNI